MLKGLPKKRNEESKTSFSQLTCQSAQGQRRSNGPFCLLRFMQRANTQDKLLIWCKNQFCNHH